MMEEDEEMVLPPIEAVLKIMFDLEDLRQFYRDNAPFGRVKGKDVKKVRKILDRVKKEVVELETVGAERYKGLQVAPSLPLRIREETALNMQPIQAGGRLPKEGRKALISYGDGYSTCDTCRAPFRLDYIKKPDLHGFYEDLAKWLNMDQVRIMPGARRAFQAVVNATCEPGDIVLLTAVSHYTAFLAAESRGCMIREVPTDDSLHITAERVHEKMEEIKSKDGRLPALAIIPHFDYLLGNEHEIVEIGKVLNDYDIPFLYNGAYTVGIQPVDGKKIGADFIVGSGHKSMASPAPTGVLAVSEGWKDKVLRTTKAKGDVTGRSFGIKEVELLGCTVMGAPLIAMYAAFPYVKERVKHWDEEVERSNYFVNKLIEIPGTEVASEMPRRHTLSKIDTTGNFDKIANEHKRRGYFFSDELKARGILGIFEGATREWKINTYGLGWEQIKYAADAFQDIAKKYGLM